MHICVYVCWGGAVPGALIAAVFIFSSRYGKIRFGLFCCGYFLNFTPEKLVTF
jgi:hypothetical protein